MNQEKEKILKTAKNVELRIIIVGEKEVGKKSITKRFKLLNCTETKEVLYSILKPNKISSGKSTSDKKLSSDNDDLDETLLEEEHKNKKSEEERINLTKFIKIYKINLNTIEISFYPCAEAEPLPYDYIPSEDNQNSKFEMENKISLNKLINEIAKIIMSPLSNPKNQLELLFLFCFDLSNRKSFKQLKLYHSEINNHFKLKENNYHSILIGNKIDKKSSNSHFCDSVNKFIEANSLKYYKISTFMFFNFENFFEKIFYEIFQKFPHFSEETFKKKFHNILEQKPTFLLSERKIYEMNSYPSPNKYKNNQYEYPKRIKDLVKLFKEKNKYNKKIFINKEGPVFPPLTQKNIFKDNLSDLSFDIKNINELGNKIFSHSKSNYDMFPNSYNITNIDTIKYKSPIIWDSDKQKEIKDILTPISRKKGVSLGITTNNALGLLQKRREKNIKINLDICNSFEQEHLNSNKKCKKNVKLSQKKYEKNRKEQYNNKLYKIQKSENKKNEQLKINIDKNNKIREDKIKFIMQKEKKYLKNYIKRQKEKLHQQKQSQNLNIIKSPIKNEKKCEFYSPVSSIQTNKGFSFGQKLEIKTRIDSPDFPNLLDDFEKILIKNAKKKNIKGAERFSESKVDTFEEDLDYLNSLNENQRVFIKKRKKFLKNKISNFIKDRKNKKILVKLNKENLIREEEKQFTTQMLKQYKTSNDYFAREINYNLVENSSPKYSITGKYRHRPSLSHQAYYGSSDDIFDNYENDEEDNNKKKPEILLENPNYDKVKPKYPSFSFGISERFKTINAHFLKKNKSNLNNDLFIDGNFSQQDTKSFLKAQTIMGTEKKFRCYKDNGVPGPGNYQIRSFADDIINKGNLKNNRKIDDKLGEKGNNITNKKTIEETNKI